MTSSLLMLVSVYQHQWFPSGTGDVVRIDPTRMAQGIMTGIGILRAGVIFKKGLSVRGLTTAAIGVLIGIGLYFAAGLAILLTLGVLGLFRCIEMRMPTNRFAQLVIRFPRSTLVEEHALRALLANLAYRLDADDQAFEYRMMLRPLKTENLSRLAKSLCGRPDVLEFRISPTGD